MAKAEDDYPVLQQIKDPATQQALRILYDKLRSVKDNASGPIVGSLKPDTKPKLTSQDAGRLFFAKDYNRTFKWTGTAWEDAPAQPERSHIAFFSPTFNPGLGWAPCNGSPVAISTSDARTLVFTPPVLPDFNGQKAWLRL